MAVITTNNNIVVNATAGCLGIDTSILMFDGTIKMVQDIVRGDLIMGPDSKPREVLCVNDGDSMLYEIVPRYGSIWVCNDEHILTVYDTFLERLLDIDIEKLLSISDDNCYIDKYRLQRNYIYNKKTEPVVRIPFLIRKMGRGKWYGFQVDKDNRFLLGDFTITHNSGKTTSIIEASKVIPYGKSALFVAFNKSIVQELKNRLPKGIDCSTMHSVGFRAIASHYPGKTSLKEDKLLQFIIPLYDLSDRKNWIQIYAIERLLTLVRATMGVVNKQGLEMVATNYALDVTEQQIEKGVIALENFYKSNDNVDRFNVTVDFQDMIEMCVKNQKIRVPQYDYVFIDEIQDLSRLDHLFIKRLVKPVTGRTIAVGDPHQCQPQGTKILMASGKEKVIEEITLGDTIAQHHRDKDGNNIVKFSEVQGISRRRVNEQIIKVTLDGVYVTRYTDNHKCIVVKSSTILGQHDRIEIMRADDLLKAVNYPYNKMIVVSGEVSLDEGEKDFSARFTHRELSGIKVEVESYTGWVYSLKAGGNETYIGDGIVTHNSIYNFKGASPDSFDRFASEPNTISLPLSISYRCDKNIVARAREVYGNIEPYVENGQGVVRKGTIEDINEGDLVICRNTRPLVDVFFELIDRDKKAYIVGSEMEKGLSDMLGACEPGDSTEIALGIVQKSYETLIGGLRSRGMTNPDANPRAVAMSEKIDILKLLFRRFSTVFDVLSFIKQVFDDKDRQGVKLSTIHKAKGTESNTVFVIETFQGKKLIPSPYAVTKDQKIQERNLEFVAVTRAKHELVYLNL